MLLLHEYMKYSFTLSLSKKENFWKGTSQKQIILLIKMRSETLRKFLDSKEHLDWLKIDLNTG